MNTTELIGAWSVAGAWVSAIASIATVVITGLALVIAHKTLHSWKDKEKTMQMVRVKRAIFTYRQKVESIRFLKHDNQKINEHIQFALQPALSDIFHEMKLAGMEEGKCTEFELFNALHGVQAAYEESHIGWPELLTCATELQEAIKVSL